MSEASLFDEIWAGKRVRRSLIIKIKKFSAYLVSNAIQFIFVPTVAQIWTFRVISHFIIYSCTFPKRSSLNGSIPCVMILTN